MNYLVVAFSEIAFVAPIVAIVINADPVGIFMEDLQLLSHHLLVKTLIRYVIMQHCILAVVRCYVTFYLPAVSTFYIFLACLKRIIKKPESENSVKYYTQLRIIQQTGMTSIRTLAALLMFTGFVLCVLGTWIIISGRQIFPVLLYCMCTLVTLVIYIVIAQTIPKIVECDELSRKLIVEIWPRRKARTIRWDSNFENKMWKMILISQKPLTFYYGLAAFDRETKHNFYYNIFSNTVDIVLLTTS